MDLVAQNSEVGHNQEAKKEINALFGAGKTLSTPPSLKDCLKGLCN